MDEQSDPNFLKKEAYDNSSDLDTRTEIQEAFSLRQVSWFRWLYQRIDLPQAGFVLELGCGPGDLWLENASRLKADLKAYLSDLSEGMVVEARRRLKDLPLNFSYSSLDVQNIPLPSQSCRLVIANGLLDHTSDRVRSLDEIHRVLAPAGIFHTSTGSKQHLKEMEDIVRPFLAEAAFGGAPERFGLENGEKILSPWFCKIGVERYTDELLFTDPQPVAAYVLSEAAIRKSLTGVQRKEFLSYLQSEIDSRGEFRVKIEKGLFTAERD
jgi:ubiquinone/menaquinone biosynthesis C-methylase UbiE